MESGSAASALLIAVQVELKPKGKPYNPKRRPAAALRSALRLAYSIEQNFVFVLSVLRMEVESGRSFMSWRAPCNIDHRFQLVEPS